MVRITMLGAGSAFTPYLMKDIMLIEGLKRGVINLIDIDPRRLDISLRYVRAIAGRIGPGWQVNASTDRRRLMKGSDYIINCIEVSGLKTVAVDYRVPLKYGVDQCIGDTIGPGGIFKALRTIPAWVEILRDVEVLCPKAIVLNYTNPMSMMTLAAVRTTSASVVGLCHSVQGTAARLARYMEIPAERLEYRCAGINHMAWFTVLKHRGRNVYPLRFERSRLKDVYEQDPVRFDMMYHLGTFVTESSGHFSEYVPYYRKRKDLVRKYMRDRYRGESGFYSKNWPKWRRDEDARRLREMKNIDSVEIKRSHEYAAVIIEAHRLNRPALIYGSVLNDGLIANLPYDGVVEAAVHVDGNGLAPCKFGKLPPQLAALCASNMYVFECAVSGILNEDKDAVYYAMTLDPLTAAVCSPAEIHRMTGEMARKQRDYIPRFMTR